MNENKHYCPAVKIIEPKDQECEPYQHNDDALLCRLYEMISQCVRDVRSGLPYDLALRKIDDWVMDHGVDREVGCNAVRNFDWMLSHYNFPTDAFALSVKSARAHAELFTDDCVPRWCSLLYKDLVMMLFALGGDGAVFSFGCTAIGNAFGYNPKTVSSFLTKCIEHEFLDLIRKGVKNGMPSLYTISLGAFSKQGKDYFSKVKTFIDAVLRDCPWRRFYSRNKEWQ